MSGTPSADTLHRALVGRDTDMIKPEVTELTKPEETARRILAFQEEAKEAAMNVRAARTVYNDAVERARELGLRIEGELVDDGRIKAGAITHTRSF